MSKLLVFLGVIIFLYRVFSQAKGVSSRIASVAAATKGGRSAHEVLGVERGADHETIRRAYQQKIQEYHPDRLNNSAAELRELAEQRMKEINDAYAKLSRHQ